MIARVGSGFVISTRRLFVGLDFFDWYWPDYRYGRDWLKIWQWGPLFVMWGGDDG